MLVAEKEKEKERKRRDTKKRYLIHNTAYAKFRPREFAINCFTHSTSQIYSWHIIWICSESGIFIPSARSSSHIAEGLPSPCLHPHRSNFLRNIEKARSGIYIYTILYIANWQH